MNEIPVVDMDPPELQGLSDDASLEAIGKQILAALGGIGFVNLIHHGVPESLREAATRAAADFFALPLDVKMKYRRFETFSMNGYTPSGMESLYRSEAGSRPLAELKESWDMKVAREELPEADAPALSRHLPELMEALDALSLRVLAALERALGRPGLFTETHRHQLGPESGAVLRAVWYPPVPDDVPAGTVRCATHSDWGGITLLLQDPVGGLEVRARSGHWTPATPLPGAVLCNVGDLMEIWTGGEARATKHRVRLPEAERQRRAGRLTLVFFSAPDDDVMVMPPEGSGAQAVNAGRFLADKYLAVFPNAGLQYS